MLKITSNFCFATQNFDWTLTLTRWTILGSQKLKLKLKPRISFRKKVVDVKVKKSKKSFAVIYFNFNWHLVVKVSVEGTAKMKTKLLTLTDLNRITVANLQHKCWSLNVTEISVGFGIWDLNKGTGAAARRHRRRRCVLQCRRCAAAAAAESSKRDPCALKLSACLEICFQIYRPTAARMMTDATNLLMLPRISLAKRGKLIGVVLTMNMVFRWKNAISSDAFSHQHCSRARLWCKLTVVIVEVCKNCATMKFQIRFSTPILFATRCLCLGSGLSVMKFNW